jgi:cyclase
MIEEIAPGVFTSDQPVADGKNGIVFGEKYTLSIDTGNGPEDGQRMVDFIRSRARTPDFLALTHSHGDHVQGAGRFAGATIIGHARLAEALEAGLARRAESSGTPVERLRLAAPFPTISLEGDARLDLGGRHVHLFLTPGHSHDSLCAYLEEEQVLFGGDTAVTGIVPAFTSGNSHEMEASLRRLAGLRVQVLVPGHGPVLRGEDTIRSWLTWMADYLAAVRAHVAAGLQAGAPGEDIALAVDYDTFIQGRLPLEPHGMLRRHQNTARAIAKELAS